MKNIYKINDLEIRNEIQRMFHERNLGEPEVCVNISKRQGATRALIYEGDINLKYIIKFDPIDVEKEKNGYHILSNVPGYNEHVLQPIYESNNFIVYPFLKHASTLQDIIFHTKNVNQNWIESVFNDFLEKTADLFKKTKNNRQYIDYSEIYVDRIYDRIDLMKNIHDQNNIRNLTININGVNYGKIGDLLDNFRRKLVQIRSSQKTYPCVIHGDEHGGNLMVYEKAINLDERKWIIIDYCNVKKESDWIFSVAKMYQWWDFYYLLELAKNDEKIKRELKSKYTIKDKILDLTYNEDLFKNNSQNICVKLLKNVKKFAEETGKVFEEDRNNWKNRLNLALFSVIFGSMPLHFNKNSYTIPVMIHKSIEYLDKCRNL